MLYKILHKVDHPFYCKFPKFIKPIHRSFVLAKFNTYQCFRCFTYSTTQFFKYLPNEAVLDVKQDRFIAIEKKFLLMDN